MEQDHQGLLEQSHSSDEAHISQEGPATVSLPLRHGLCAACNICSLRANPAVNFRGQQLGPFVNFIPCKWRSERYILIASTAYLLSHTGLPLCTGLGSSSTVDLSSRGEIQKKAFSGMNHTSSCCSQF